MKTATLSAKRVLAVTATTLCAAFLSLLLTACAGTDDQSGSDEGSTTEEEQSQAAESPMYFTEGTSFCDGVALVGYSNSEGDVQGDNHYAIIDKTGSARFVVAAEDPENGSPYRLGRDYNDGYFYLVASDPGDSAYGLLMIDTEGNVRMKHSRTDQGTGVVAYGGGFAVLQTNESGFDASTYEYAIHDENDETVCTFGPFERAIDISYVGSGVFSYTVNDQGRGTSTHYFFCPGTGEFAQTEAFMPCPVQFYDETAIVGVENDDKDETYTATLLSAETGEMSTIEIETGDAEGDRYNYGIVKDGTCVLQSNNNTYLLTCDMQGGNVHEIDDEYAARMDEASARSKRLIAIPGDDRFNFFMRGEDGKLYLLLFDETLKPVGDPIALEDIGLSEYPESTIGERFAGEPTYQLYDSERLSLLAVVLDPDGNVVCTEDDVVSQLQADWEGLEGDVELCEFREGVARASGGSVFDAYFDVDGNLLFSQIDVAGAKEIAL